MIPLQQLRNAKDEIILRLAKRGKDYRLEIEQIIKLDEDRRQCQKVLDELLAKANIISKEIALAFKEGNKNKAESLKQESLSMKANIVDAENRHKELSAEIQNALYELPNAPHISVPFGKSAEENEEVYSWGNIPNLPESALPHWDLVSKYDLIDFELGNKIAGAGFPVYKGKGARLQRALINFFLDKALQAGYLEIQPPIVVNEASGYGTGQLPDKEGQMYYIGLDDLYLIPTAEVPITNLYRDVILKEEDFPIKNVGYTPCFRREAGSYGAHVRGLNRLHQFDKVEIVQIANPKNSYDILDEMLEHVKSLLMALNLPFRILRLCGGDMGFASALTYDFEVYSTAQKRWLEVSSVSNFESFQSNRLKLRFKNAEGKNELAHTLNGSAMALPRIVAALLENNQDANGITMPRCLHSYLQFDRI